MHIDTYHHLSRLLERAAKDHGTIDKYLDWLIQIGGTDEYCEVAEFAYDWFTDKPKDIRLTLLNAIVGRLKDRVVGTDDFPDEWQSQLGDSLSNLDTQAVRLLIAWVPEDCWVREFVDDEIEVRKNQATQKPGSSQVQSGKFN